MQKKTQPNITSVGRPARRQSPVSEPLRSVFRPLSNGNGPSWIWFVMIRLNYGCDKRVHYCALIFAADIVPSLSTIQWDFKKPACESTEGSARPLKKKISCQTQKCNFWKRPSTDFDKNYIFGIGTSSAIEWYLSFLLSISWPSDEPWELRQRFRQLSYSDPVSVRHSSFVLSLHMVTWSLAGR